MFLIAATAAGAQTTFTIDNLNYTVLDADARTVSVKGISGIAGKVVIPSTVSNEGVVYTVTDVGDSAFRENNAITSVSLPSTILRIGDWAFYKCANLADFEMGDKVEELGGSVFSFSGITSINLPGTLKVLAIPCYDGVYRWGLFERCFNLASATLNEGLTEIPVYAFYNCTSLKEITIPASVKKIGRAPFYFNSNSPKPSEMKRMVLADSDEPVEFNNSSSTYTSGRANLTPPCCIDYFYLGRDVKRVSNQHSLVYATKVIEIGPKVTDIELLFSATGDSNSQVTDVKVLSTTPISIVDAAFHSNVYANATLWVPAGTAEAYGNAPGWKLFANIMEMEPTKCARPTATLEDGKLKFSCDTEGVNFHYEFSYPQGGKGTGNEVAVLQTITVSVYASREGLEDSDVAVYELSVAGGSGITGDVNGDKAVNVADIANIIDIMAKN